MLLPVGLDRPFYRRPVVTLTIMALCVLVQLAQDISRNGHEQIIRLGYIPGYGSLYHLISHMFVHAGWGHLIGNMLFLWLAGFKVEDALGWWRYLLFYLGSGVAANGMHLLFSDGLPIPSVGASGAIAGVMGGFMVLFPWCKIRAIYWIMFQSGTIMITSWIYLGFWFARELLSLKLSAGAHTGIAFGAHVGGFAAGAIWIWAFYGWDEGERLEERYLVGQQASWQA